MPFLQEELGIAVEDSRDPKWDTPKLKDAAAKMKVVINRRGVVGPALCDPPEPSRRALHDRGEERRCRRHLVRERLSGLPRRHPNHMYSFSFEPNHAWPYHFSTQDVLHAYFRRIADKYKLRKHIRFETSVVEAAFDEKISQLERQREGQGRQGRDAARQCGDQRRRPAEPAQDARHQGPRQLQGPGLPYRALAPRCRSRGKARPRWIGTGATAFQVIPEIAPKVKALLVFQRSAPWLGPTPNYHDKVADGKKWLLEHVPYYGKWLPLLAVLDIDRRHPRRRRRRSVLERHQPVRQPDERDAARTSDREDEGGRFPDATISWKRSTPDYPFGSKRSVRDNGVYLAALARPNVDLITDGIEEITPKGIRTKDGKEHEVDVIIYGTGFHASDFLRTYRIVGRGGVELHERWKGDARAYLGMTVPGFPNFFAIYGPNTNIVVNGSIIFFSEASVRLHRQLPEAARRDGCRDDGGQGRRPRRIQRARLTRRTRRWRGACRARRAGTRIRSARQPELAVQAGRLPGTRRSGPDPKDFTLS